MLSPDIIRIVPVPQIAQARSYNRKTDTEPKKDLKGTLKDRVNPGGFCVLATYVLIVVVVFAFTASTTKPSNVGYDWIPFILLSMPWYAINQRLLLPGLIANAGLMYLLGTLLQACWSRIVKK
jgi:hypothetical protein